MYKGPEHTHVFDKAMKISNTQIEISEKLNLPVSAGHTNGVDA
jgi:hypothetical protein